MRVPGLSFEDDVERLAWRPTRMPGVWWLPLHLEADAEREGAATEPRRPVGATVLIRMEPGRGYARHRHVGTEDVLVLRGGYRDENGSYRQGDHVHYPAGSVHSPRALGDADRPVDEANPACILYSTVPRGIEYV